MRNSVGIQSYADAAVRQENFERRTGRRNPCRRCGSRSAAENGEYCRGCYCQMHGLCETCGDEIVDMPYETDPMTCTECGEADE